MDEALGAEGVPQDSKLIGKVNRILASNKRQRALYDAQIEKVRKSYLDKFWAVANEAASSGGFELTHPVSDTMPVNIQVNYLSGFIATHQAGLTYGDVTPDVQAAPHLPIPLEAADAIRRLCHQWVNSVGVSERTTQVVVLSLLEGEAAYLLTVRDGKNLRVPALDRIRLDVVTRSDLLIDRDSKNWDLSYIGYTREETSFSEGGSSDDTMPRKKTYAAIFDFDGTATVTLPAPNDDGSVTDGTPPVTEGTELGMGGNDDPNALTSRDVELPGQFVDCCLQGGMSDKSVEKIEVVGPIPDTDAFGRPIAPIVPVMLTADPRYPHRGHPSSLRAYAIVEPKNQLSTWRLRAAQKDMARTIVVDADQLEGDAVDKYCQGNLDQILRKKKWVNAGTERPKNDPIQFVQAPPIPQTVDTLDKDLEAIRQSTQGLSPLTRGEQLDYATATEVTASVEYSEAALSPMRRDLNGRLCDLLRLFLRILARVLEDAGETEIVIASPDGTPIAIPLEWLAHPWNISLKDGNITPMADEKRRIIWKDALPRLVELYQLRAQAMAPQVSDPMTMQPLGPPPDFTLAAFVEQAIEYEVQIDRLPPNFALDQIKARAKLLAPPLNVPMLGGGSVAPPMPGAPPGGGPPQQGIDPEADEAAALEQELGPMPEF